MEGGTAFSFATDAFKFLRGPSIGELDWLINNRMLSARCHCHLLNSYILTHQMKHYVPKIACMF